MAVDDRPINMGHFDAIVGALIQARGALQKGGLAEAWADIDRALGYAYALKRRVPEGRGFSDEDDTVAQRNAASKENE